MIETMLKKMVWVCRVFLIGLFAYSALAETPQIHQEQKDIQIKNLQDYLNGIHTLRANFTQRNPNQTVSTGMMYIKRFGQGSFGKLRLEYAPPSHDRIIANGEILRHEDGQTKEVNEYAIENTPASFLLRHKIDFSDDLQVKSFENEGHKIYLTVQRPGDDGVTLTLVFVTSPLLRLQEWSLLDAQGNNTDVKLTNVEIGLPLADKLFKF